MPSKNNTSMIAIVSEHPVGQNTSDNTVLYIIIFGPIWFVIGVIIFHFIAVMMCDVCHLSYSTTKNPNKRHNSECDNDEGIQLCVLTAEQFIQPPYLHYIV